MDYSQADYYKLNKCKQNITKYKLKEIQSRKELKFECRKQEIKKIKNLIASSKGQQTRNKNLISKIVGPYFIQSYNDNLIGLIINKLYKPYEINRNCILKILYTTNSIFRNIILELYNIIRIGYTDIPYNIHLLQCRYKVAINYKLTFIQKKIGYKFNNQELEQLLYLPFTKHTRSFIHLFVRNNKLEIIKNLVSKFNKLNINVPTIVDSWLPIHNALWFNNDLIYYLISLGIKDNWNFQNTCRHKFDDIYHYIAWLNINKNYSFDKELDYIRKCIYIHKYKVDLQTEINYKDIQNYETDTVEILRGIYSFLDNNINRICSFELL